MKNPFHDGTFGLVPDFQAGNAWDQRKSRDGLQLGSENTASG
jgi:hypothetical protein